MADIWERIDEAIDTDPLTIRPIVAKLLQRAELAERAERALRQVRRLHERYRFAGDETTDYCAHCNRGGNWVPYPCPTLQAIDAALDPPEDAP